ncbi:hypothetical protein SE17_08925 [Kouleothrix aurantiaca]|uniref:Uncharacterized protein n=1 Tax=Kouleothrix aurantiaca TaxID=186479 RepID=A0A0P9DJC2_9CHLR|nr:hypothetical protein SE17_08925 [Kouleothrix aurantiaca]
MIQRQKQNEFFNAASRGQIRNERQTTVMTPNTRLQRTPLRVERDRAFFSASFCYNVAAINRWRRR